MIKWPVLDDKGYRQIFNESLAMIPSLTDKWTDFNPQDTGIMLLELLSGMTEMQNFYLDQVGDRFYRQLLAPLVDSDPSRTMDSLFADLEHEQATLKRAVTEGDYQKILMNQHLRDFMLDGAEVKADGKTMRITVWRNNEQILLSEMEKIGQCLEKYRLLTTRIVLEQRQPPTGSEIIRD